MEKTMQKTPNCEEVTERRIRDHAACGIMCLHLYLCCGVDEYRAPEGEQQTEAVLVSVHTMDIRTKTWENTNASKQARRTPIRCENVYPDIPVRSPNHICCVIYASMSFSDKWSNRKECMSAEYV